MSENSPVTDAMRAMIGREGEPVTAWDAVCKSEIRRYVQAVMDDNPIYWDEEYAKQTKFGGIVAPGTFLYRAFRQAPGTPDPLRASPPDEDVHEPGWKTLGGVDVPRPDGWTVFHGGNEVEVYQLAKPGEVITARTRLADIFEKDGRTGKMIFEVHETRFYNQQGELLSIDRLTAVFRRVPKAEDK